jgi:hypothetical protein
LFHAPTREPIGFEEIIRHYGEIGIANWSTHDTDIIPTRVLGTEEQWAVVERVKKALQENGVRCSMVTTETFFHEVWAAGPADAQALPGGQAFRAAGGNPAAHQRRHAGLHQFRAADPPRDGWAESRVPA